MKWHMIKDIMPIIITAAIAIIGYIFQFLFFVVERKQKLNDTRLTSVGQYYFDLMRLLDILQNNLMGLMGNNFIYLDASTRLFDVSQDSLEDSLKSQCEDIFSIYLEIEKISSSGKYMYMNKKIHKLMLQLSGHIASILFSKGRRLSKDQLDKLKSSYPLPDVSLLMRFINEASK